MTLTIRALGPLVIQADGITLRKLPKKASALLVYLAMQDGDPISRNKIADLLWPDQDSLHALHSLRNTLLEIKKSCGRAIDADLKSCGLAASIDVKRFAALAASHDRRDLDAALNLYRGDLLEDFNLTPEPWEEWCIGERDGLREIAIHVAQQLTRLAYVAGDHELAISAGRRAVALDRFNEVSQRALMQAYAEANQRGAAIRQYKNFEKLMYDELGVQPEDETRALRDAYCKRMAPPLPRMPRPVRLETSDELRWIAAEFTLALGGHTKLAPALVRQSVVAMIEAANALECEPETRMEHDFAQPTAA